jgi:hypothetical protein
MPIPETQMKLVDADKVPGLIRRKRQEWIELLGRIPIGKAWVIDEKDSKFKAPNVKAMVNRIMREGDVKDTYRVVQRTRSGKATIYIINEGKDGKWSGGEQKE